MNVNIVSNQTVFGQMYVKGPQGWVKLSGKAEKAVNGSEVRKAFDSARAKRSILLSANEVQPPVSSGLIGTFSKVKNLAQTPILLTNKTAREFVCLIKEEKAAFFNKYLKQGIEISGDVQTQSLGNHELYNLF